MEEIRITIRFPKDAVETLRQLAQEHNRSLNGEVVWGIRSYIRHCQKEKVDGDDDHGAQNPPEPHP